jgi:hypothetical protein
MNMQFTHTIHLNKTDKLKRISYPLQPPVSTNGKSKNDIIKREPINYFFDGMIHRVNNGNLNCESCHKK